VRGGCFIGGLVVLALAGCAQYDAFAPRNMTVTERAAARHAKADGPLTIAELDELTNVFADNYVARVATACDQVIESAKESGDIADASYLKVVTAISTYDIVSEPDALSQLLDLLTLVTVQHLVWVEEGVAKTLFEDGATPIIEAVDAGQSDLFTLAARALKPEQIAEVQDQVRTWRKKNADLRFVAMVRFEQAASERAAALESTVRSGGGLMAPVNDAVDSLERARRLAERSFYVGKRLPMMIGWQLDHVISRALMRNELAGGLQSLERTSTLSESIPNELREIRGLLQTEPRKIIDELAARQQAADKTLATLGDTITAGAKLVDSAQATAAAADRTIASAEKASAELRETLAAADRLLTRLESAGLSGSSARRLEDYTAAAEKVATMAKEINQAIKSGDELLASAAWEQRLGDINAAARERLLQTTGAAEAVTDRAFWRVLLAIGALLIAGMAYKMFAVWVTKRAS
jgi:hypothetical protein